MPSRIGATRAIRLSGNPSFRRSSASTVVRSARCPHAVPPMRCRTFPRTGWSISEIGYGMWGMGGWTGSNDDESAQALDRAVELGCTFFDTAWAYGNGHSERLLGALLR